MLSGRRFQLRVATVAIQGVDGRRVATTIPAGETILVVSGPRPDDRRMVDVLWNNCPLVVFCEDIQLHGAELNSATR